MSSDDKGWLPIWAIPCGSICGVRLRISLLVPLFAFVLCAWFGLRLGLSLSAILTFSVMWHAQGRCLGGTSLRRLTLWPGGCLERDPEQPPTTRISADLGGLLANLLICGIFALPLSQEGRLSSALDPFALGSFRLQDDAWGNVIYLQFALNWILVLVNLLPLPPFCVGRIFAELTERFVGVSSGERLFQNVGIALALFLMIVGLCFEQSLLIALSGLSIASLLCMPTPQSPLSDDVDETFLGYDFSEGYTSLNRSVTQETPPPPTFLQQWKENRERTRREKEAELDREVDRELDRILEKVHATGLSSLSQHESRLLNRASERLRHKT